MRLTSRSFGNEIVHGETKLFHPSDSHGYTAKNEKFPPLPLKWKKIKIYLPKTHYTRI